METACFIKGMDGSHSSIASNCTKETVSALLAMYVESCLEATLYYTNGNENTFRNIGGFIVDMGTGEIVGTMNHKPQTAN